MVWKFCRKAQFPQYTVWKVSKYGVISGSYFPAFGLNTDLSVSSPNSGKYGPEITPYLDTFHAVIVLGYLPKLHGNCAFPQNFHTMKLGEITVL